MGIKRIIIKTALIRHLVIVLLLIACSEKKERAFYPDGSVLYEVSLKNGERHGLLRKYYKSGNLEMTSTWQNGLKHGIVKGYFDNGIIKAEEHFQHHKKNGICSYFDSSGVIIEKATYREGKKEGLYMGYYDNGKLQIVTSYKGDLLHGKATFFGEDSVVIRKSVFQHDTVVYNIEYTTDNELFNRYMEIKVVPDESNIYKIGNPLKFQITLDYSYYDDSYISLAIGELSEHNLLQDTLQVITSKNKRVDYQFVFQDKQDKNIEGYILEYVKGTSVAVNLSAFNVKLF